MLADGASAELGIPIRISRNSDLVFSPKIYLHRLVADLFVWHIHAASRWADYVGRGWAHYLDARSNSRVKGNSMIAKRHCRWRGRWQVALLQPGYVC